MLDEQDKSTLIGALQYIIRRLQMDIDDGSRPDQWSMEDLVRVANDALKAQQPAPVDADEIERLTREIAELKADRDSWIEQASARAQETVEAMQQVEAYRLRCEALQPGQSPE